MDVRRLHPIFGAELSGPDLSQVPDQALIDLVERLMDEHVVLCIRCQGHITDEEHLRFARAFGPLELPGMYRPDEPRRMAYGLYDASNLDVNGEIVDRESLRAKFAKGNEIFHADSSFNDMPSKWSMLRGVIVPPERGDTEFVDLRHVYDELPQAMKDRIETLVAEHSFAASRIKGGASPEEAARIREIMPGAMQPMVRISPSGRKSLFVGSHAFRVEGLSDAEGTALIDELIAFASQEKFIYAHKWRQGDLLIWDNRYALHRGTAFDYVRYKRDLRRANVNEYGEERSAITAPLRSISN
ncbi:alpha-ketoglutarate-dependent 2,4-dichlorophenoxyacetate dioxygenase [Sphingobium sp. B1D7B]|uniref:TauD/TfdA dioxygenase family protein n=1 Tax=unclassified Sphingobium TaxID=2611147 RepID=UPI002224F67D|nr:MULTISPECIES: TauD/TfdA family dioxygenase [unclassified Sphingobium]MCW2392202.1 alpha-ketoglutarate-dependent 2,4-dichlorophenoxyacetate dioxygenase [Sphingobium sp. B11D3A]MCW2403908.1 alpha-ketoglutarate-dependent 2,4-dichlorophenoxyacetate dioxygenase [Sphingobium sp. B1D7B]